MPICSLPLPWQDRKQFSILQVKDSLMKKTPISTPAEAITIAMESVTMDTMCGLGDFIS
jgi:hypothetical protein